MASVAHPESDVLFYCDLDAEFGEFSNFFAAPITLDGKVWPATEHYFQAQKFPTDAAIREKIRDFTDPGEAAREGRDRSNPLREDWEQVKDDVMFKALKAKFTQHNELRDVLLSTGKRSIVEHIKTDSYWGDGGDGSGKNMMGKLLMRLREELRGT